MVKRFRSGSRLRAALRVQLGALYGSDAHIQRLSEGIGVQVVATFITLLVGLHDERMHFGVGTATTFALCGQHQRTANDGALSLTGVATGSGILNSVAFFLADSAAELWNIAVLSAKRIFS
jgi:hypothetical protein